MSTLLFSTTILAAFIGGILALVAPCCISVMLPAYFASSFRRRTQIVGMTLVFAAGVATVILPIALGATVLSRLLIGQHVWVFGIGGLLMVAAGLAMLTGKSFSLPMFGSAGATDGSLRSVYGLGVFSGGASACCAPVLVGVAALAGASASFPIALVIGVVYVFGMVAPLALIAVLWDRRDWGSSNLFRNRQVTLRLGRRRRTVPLTVVISAALMVFMGVLTAALALSGRGMATSNWQVEMAAGLQHFASVILDALSWLPTWAGSAIVLGVLALFIRAGLRQRRSEPSSATPVPPSTDNTDERPRQETL
jgi:cytochrome c biogenesis protein CcdA